MIPSAEYTLEERCAMKRRSQHQRQSVPYSLASGISPGGLTSLGLEPSMPMMAMEKEGVTVAELKEATRWRLFRTTKHTRTTASSSSSSSSLESATPWSISTDLDRVNEDVLQGAPITVAFAISFTARAGLPENCVFVPVECRDKSLVALIRRSTSSSVTAPSTMISPSITRQRDESARQMLTPQRSTQRKYSFSEETMSAVSRRGDLFSGWAPSVSFPPGFSALPIQPPQAPFSSEQTRPTKAASESKLEMTSYPSAASSSSFTTSSHFSIPPLNLPPPVSVHPAQVVK